MSKCIWNVEPEDRHCRFCTWDGGCTRSEAKPRVAAQTYLDVMNQIAGYDIRQRNRKWRMSHLRYIVAYQMSQDGFNQYVIADLIHRDRATVSYGIATMREMLSLPYIYSDEMAVWKEYSKIINTLKDENVSKI